MAKRRFYSLVILTLFSLLFSACTQTPGPSNGKLTVIATTTLIGDVAANIGGDQIELTVMMPAGVDPHSFEPAPADLSKVANADVVLINGIEFEAFLAKLIENARDEAKIVTVSEGIETITLEEDAHEEDDHADEEHAHEHGEFDPHVWHDPNNVILWANHMAAAFSERDPAHAAAYRANADAYILELQALDAWIKTQVALVPEANRRLVTEHGTLGYFAARYGFEVVGAAIPGFSTLAQPSAQELAALSDAIRDLGVKAIFVGNTVNPNLASQIAQDTGIQLVPIYTDSLSPVGGPAATYLAFMRFNVEAIVGALK